MAAELPVIASDWSGYRDLVEHGVSGLLVPTADVLAGAGLDSLERRYRLGLLDYDTMVGLRGLAVAVNPQALLAALTLLQAEPQRRQAMGLAGRQRLQQRFSAAVVAQQYRQLWHELAQRRQAAAAAPPELVHVPYGRLFAGFGSRPIGAGPWQRNASSSSPQLLLGPMQQPFVQYWCNPGALAAWLEGLPLQQPLSQAMLLEGFSQLGIAAEHQRPLLACLLKLAIVEEVGP